MGEENPQNVTNNGNEQPVAPPAPMAPLPDAEPATSAVPTPPTMPAEAAQPAAPQPPLPVLNSPAPAAKKGKKLLVVGAIVAGALALVGGGSAYAYTAWYQNPDKVLLDTVSQLLAEDNYTATSAVMSKSSTDTMNAVIDSKMRDGQTSMTATLDIALKNSDAKYTIKGGAMAAKDGTLYLQVKDSAKLVDALIDEQIKSYGTLSDDEAQMAKGFVHSMYEPITKQLDTNWVKITDKDVPIDMKCTNEAYTLLRTDEAMQKELVTAFTNNRILVLQEKLPAKDGSIGLKYRYNQAAQAGFDKAAQGTAFGIKMAACTKTTDDTNSSEGIDELAPADKAQKITGTVELWVDRWSHKLTSTKVHFTNSDNDVIDMTHTPKYNQNVTIDTPKNTITVDQLGDLAKSMYSF